MQAPAGQLELANAGDAPDRLQTRIYRWTRNQCRDQLEPTQGLIASPPILTVPPASKRLVRVLLTDRRSGLAEASYRISLTEIGEVTSEAGRVATRLNISLPIFIRPAGAAASRLQWSVARDGPALRLAVTNAGNLHDRLTRIQVLDGQGKVVREEARADYLLAGDSCSWPLPDGRSVIVTTESGEARLAPPER